LGKEGWENFSSNQGKALIRVRKGLTREIIYPCGGDTSFWFRNSGGF